MLKTGGLRKRWLLNTAGVVFLLGVVCVLAVTASFAAYYYSNMQSDMEDRAQTTTEFFANYLDQNYNSFYQSCITYAQTFADRNILELQFINTQGDLVHRPMAPGPVSLPRHRRSRMPSVSGEPSPLWERIPPPANGSWQFPAL